MQATELLNPGDFHQVTRQIRELVAYAISQLEISEGEGSLPSGKFAAFLHDAATKCPGFVPGGPGGPELAPNQAIIEDGDSLYINGKHMLVTVKDGVLDPNTKFTKTSIRVYENGDKIDLNHGRQRYGMTFEFGWPSDLARLDRNDICIIADGMHTGMHDQGGEPGDITWKVTNAVISDVAFTTNKAHIVREDKNFQCYDISGNATTITARVAPDNTLAFDMSIGASILVPGQRVELEQSGAQFGAVVSFNNKTIKVRPNNAMAVQTSGPVELFNQRETTPSGAAVPVSGINNGWTTHMDAESDTYVLKNGKDFSAGNATYRPTIRDGRITTLLGVS